MGLVRDLHFPVADEPRPLQIIVEHIAPSGDNVGAQAIFAFEWTETIIEEVPMAKEKKPGRGRAHGDYIARWQLMLDNIAPLLQQFPYLQAVRDELATILDEAVALNAQQEKLKADLSEVTENLYKHYDDGDNTHAKIIRHLKGEWGPKSPKLKAFLSKTEGEIDKTKEGWGDKEPEPVQPK